MEDNGITMEACGACLLSQTWLICYCNIHFGTCKVSGNINVTMWEPTSPLALWVLCKSSKRTPHLLVWRSRVSLWWEHPACSVHEPSFFITLLLLSELFLCPFFETAVAFSLIQRPENIRRNFLAEFYWLRLAAQTHCVQTDELLLKRYLSLHLFILLNKPVSAF